MKTKARVLYALWWGFSMMLGQVAASLLYRPGGEAWSFAYLFHDGRMLGGAIGAVIVSVIMYFVGPGYVKFLREMREDYEQRKKGGL